MGDGVIIDVVFKLLLFQLFFNTCKSFLRCQQLLLDELLLLLNTTEFLLQFEKLVLHFHYFTLLLLVGLKHLLGVLESGDGN